MEFRDMAEDLANLLDIKLIQTNIIPESLQSESVREHLKNMMDVIEKTLKLINVTMDVKSLGKSLVAALCTSLTKEDTGKWITRRTEITGLKTELEQASESLNSCLISNIYVMVQVYGNDSLLKEKLRPVLPARSSADHRGCLEGTREAPLKQIMSWAEEVDTPSRLYHVHGVAGSGKSSIASTVCQRLEGNLLAGAFFCKRDIPGQRDPNRILPSLSYTLALRHEAYKERVLRSLKDEPDITSRSIEQQLKVLFLDPLSELLQNGSTLFKPFIFVIDALDECGDNESRSKLADSLLQITTFTDWLKVFITSRPAEELMWKLAPADTRILSINLNDMDAGEDIKLYTQTSLKELVDRFRLNPSWLTEETIQKLTHLASGLFIWTSTMMKYVRGRRDKDSAMKLILSGKAATAEASLDDLYRKVIEGSGSDKDDLALTKAVLGVICITARNRPLSIDGLYDFIQGSGESVSKETLEDIINHLRSVLYEDTTKERVIRVCHPSFLDFLENHERSRDYWTNAEQLHATMIETSLNLMRMGLRFNICNLKTSYIANKDVTDLPQKIKDNIPESLIYSCMYWTTHLTKANRATVEVLVLEFFQHLKAVYWIEVLSLVDGLRIGLSALQSVMDFFNVCHMRCLCYQSIYSSSFVGKSVRLFLYNRSIPAGFSVV